MGTWIQEFHTQAQSWLSDLQALDGELTMEDLLKTGGPENKHLMACVSALFKLIVSMCTARRFAVKDIIITDMASLEDMSLDEGLKSKSFLPGLSHPTIQPQNNPDTSHLVQSGMLISKSSNPNNYHPLLRGMIGENSNSPSTELTDKLRDDTPASNLMKLMSKREDSLFNESQASTLSTNLLKMLSNEIVQEVAPKLMSTSVTKLGLKTKAKPKPPPRSPSPPSTAIRSKFPLLAQTISNTPRTSPMKVASNPSTPKSKQDIQPMSSTKSITGINPLPAVDMVHSPLKSPLKESPAKVRSVSTPVRGRPPKTKPPATPPPKSPPPATPPGTAPPGTIPTVNTPPVTTPPLCRSGRKAAQKANIMLAQLDIEESEDEDEDEPQEKIRTPKKRKKTVSEVTVPQNVLQFTTLQAILSGPGPLIKRGRSTKAPPFPQSTADALVQATKRSKSSPIVPEPIVPTLPPFNAGIVKEEMVDQGYKAAEDGFLEIKQEPVDDSYSDVIHCMGNMVRSAKIMNDKVEADQNGEPDKLSFDFNPSISSIVGGAVIKQEPVDTEETVRSPNMMLNMECESEDVINSESPFTKLQEPPKKSQRRKKASTQKEIMPRAKAQRRNVNRRRKPVVTFAAHICFYQQCESNAKPFESLEDLLDHWKVHFGTDERGVGYLQCWLNESNEGTETQCSYRAHLPQNKTSTRFFYHQGMSIVLDHMMNIHSYPCPPYIIQFQGPCPVQGLNPLEMVAPGLRKSADNQRTSVLTMKKFVCFYTECADNNVDFQLLEPYIEHWRDKHFQADGIGQRSMKCWRCNFKTSLPKPPKQVTRFHYHLGITSLLQHLLKKHCMLCPDYVVHQQCGVENCSSVLLTIAQAEKHRAEHSEPVIPCEHCGTAVKRRCLAMHLKTCHVKVSVDSGITWETIVKKPKGKLTTRGQHRNREPPAEGGNREGKEIGAESPDVMSSKNEPDQKEKLEEKETGEISYDTDMKAVDETASDAEEYVPKDSHMDDTPDKFEPGYTHRSMCVLHEFYCFLCRDGHDFGSIHSYLQHWRTKHTVVGEKSANMPCKVCGKQYRMQRVKLSSQWHVHATMTRLLGHLIHKHNMPAPDFIEHIVCPEKGCGRKYFASYCLETHLRTHRIRTEHCPFCKTAVSYGKLPAHLARCSTYSSANAIKESTQANVSSTLDNSPMSQDDSNLSDTPAEPMDSDISDLEESGGPSGQLFGNVSGDSALTLESALPIPDNLHEGMARRRNASLCMFKKYVCFFCDSKPDFSSDTDYFQHWKLNHVVYEEDKDFIPCKDCDKSFHVRRCNNLDNMYFVHHAITNYVRHTIKSHGVAPPECVARIVCMGRRSHRQICHKVFITREHFDNHQKQHLNINCNLCGKMIRATSQSMHYRFCKGLRRSNGQWNLYDCEPTYSQYCCMLCPGVDIVYADRDALTQHLLSEHVHQNEKDRHCISCPACDAVLPLQTTRDLESAVRVSLTNYIQHLYKKHELPPPPYVEPFHCPVGGCDYAAERVLLIAEHLKSHTETPEDSVEMDCE